ncbi:MAG: hypothetical protein NPINA01_14050 [Nitrospinaceae bacterium]|nr:MAG: hypothetical protein NPINA01_14050 [Nitrospinaceae bacterium]
MVFVTFYHKHLPQMFAGLLYLVWSLTSAYAQAGDAEIRSPISVEVHVAPTQATIGDIITYSIRVRHDPGIEPAPPKFAPPEGLESVDQGTRKLPKKRNQLEREFWFSLRADRVGSYTFPPIPLPFQAVKAENGSKKIPGYVSTPKADLEIQSILHLEGPPTDIRDIKPLEEIGRDWLPWIMGTIAAIIAIALIVFLIRRRGKNAKVTPSPLPENLSPQEAALRELEILKNKELLEKGLVREHYFELSEIFRRYLGARYEFQALDWTTEEIKNHLASSFLMEAPFKDRVRNILERTDLVKFAEIPTPPQENIMEEITLFVQATSRTEEPDPALNHSSGDA